jgi:hypothetical protein
MLAKGTTRWLRADSSVTAAQPCLDAHNHGTVPDTDVDRGARLGCADQISQSISSNAAAIWRCSCRSGKIVV